jgi:hypothetical protein
VAAAAASATRVFPLLVGAHTTNEDPFKNPSMDILCRHPLPHS